MKTQLYKNTAGQWIFDGGSMPSGSCYERYRNGTVRIYLLNQAILFEGKVSDLLRGDGTPYENYATFKSECGDFFVNPLNPLKEDVEGLQEDVTALQEGKADLVEGKVPDEQLPETTFPTIAVEGLERAVADAINHLLARINALEQLIANAKLDTFQFENLSVVDNIKIKGADLFLFGTSAPAVSPDFIGQFFIDTLGGVTYQSKGITNASDWKATSNA